VDAALGVDSFDDVTDAVRALVLAHAALKRW
jgi:hypothetical protein